MIRRVVIESPFAGSCDWERERNIAYARAALRDSLLLGEAPIASHLLYTQPGVFDDSVPLERARGIAAGHAWIAHCDAVVVYTDFGISPGMVKGIQRAKMELIEVEGRTIPGFDFPAKEDGTRVDPMPSAEEIFELLEIKGPQRRARRLRPRFV